MLYSFLRLLMLLTVRVFFRSITVRNSDQIPGKGPLMVLANHPSTFMDPIVIATLIRRKVFFLAKGELFKSGFAKWLLPKFNMIPVYRKQDDPSQMSRNEETFKKCFEHLERGGTILMFPEGVSITERKLKPIKSGAARIVLGAEERNDFKLNVKVVTIGLNYEDPHRFNRSLFVNIDKPIEAASYQQIFNEDPFKGVAALSETIRERLEKLIIDIDDKRTDELVSNIEQLYKRKLSKEMNLEADSSHDFMISKNIVDTVRYYSILQPQRVETMKKRLHDYFDSLKKIGISDNDISDDRPGSSFIMSNLRYLFTIVLGFPFYVYGLINNYLPFEIPALAARKISSSIEFRGAIGMVGGMFSFLIFYTFQIWLVWHFSSSSVLTVIYALSLPLSGLFAYWYYHTVSDIRASWILMMIFYKKRTVISGLITERESIIAEFDKARDEYAAAMSDEKNSRKPVGPPAF
jgi:1-acyl-sn-glycerol-3-phosphate acyltransferase